jgi:hypothetical protein
LTRQFFFEATECLFADCDYEVRVSLILRSLVLLLLLQHINPSPHAFRQAAFPSSPFRGPPEPPLALADIAVPDDVHRILSGPARQTVYRFGFLIDPAGRPLFGDLFEAARSYMERVSTGNQMILFWKRQFTSFAARADGEGHPSLLLNQIAPLFYQKAADEDVRRLRAARSAVAAVYGSLVPSGDAEPDLVSAYNDVGAILHTLERVRVRNARGLRCLLRENGHALSPWADAILRNSRTTRVFRCCPSGAQPLVRGHFVHSPEQLLAPEVDGGAAHCRCVRVRIGRETPAALVRVDNGLLLVGPAAAIRLPRSAIKRVDSIPQAAADCRRALHPRRPLIPHRLPPAARR